MSIHTPCAAPCDITVINSKQVPAVSRVSVQTWVGLASVCWIHTCTGYVAGNKSNAVMSPQNGWNTVCYTGDVRHWVIRTNNTFSEKVSTTPHPGVTMRKSCSKTESRLMTFQLSCVLHFQCFFLLFCCVLIVSLCVIFEVWKGLKYKSILWNLSLSTVFTFYGYNTFTLLHLNDNV